MNCPQSPGKCGSATWLRQIGRSCLHSTCSANKHSCWVKAIKQIRKHSSAQGIAQAQGKRLLTSVNFSTCVQVLSYLFFCSISVKSKTYCRKRKWGLLLEGTHLSYIHAYLEKPQPVKSQCPTRPFTGSWCCMQQPSSIHLVGYAHSDKLMRHDLQGIYFWSYGKQKMYRWYHILI